METFQDNKRHGKGTAKDSDGSTDSSGIGKTINDMERASTAENSKGTYEGEWQLDKSMVMESLRGKIENGTKKLEQR